MSDGTIVVGTGGISSRFLKKDWPITEGLIGGTTKTHGRKVSLEAEEGSNIKKIDKELI